MHQLRVPAGSEVFLGAPKVPMEPKIVAALGGLVDNTPEVIEAHLPQAFVPGTMSTPMQVLVIVTEESDRHVALTKLGTGLGGILPDGRPIDVWPLSPGDRLLPAVRGAN